MKCFWVLSSMLVIAGCVPVSVSTQRAGDSGVSSVVGPDAGFVVADSGVGASVDAGSWGGWACVALISQRCDYLQRCGLISSDPTTHGECEAYFTATWCGPTKWLSRVTPAVNTLRFEPNAAQACADAFDSRSCSEWSSEPEVCGRFLLPNAKLRETCYDGYTECAEGVCRGLSCGDRRCRPLGVDGEDCRTSSDCVSGLYCRSTQTAGVGVCSKPALVGDACSGVGECAAGLTCLGQCLALPSAGTACVMGRCDASSFCVQGADGGVCQSRGPVGLKCGSDAQCAMGLVCDAKLGLCTPALVTEPGGACSDQQLCANGLACVRLSRDSATGTCQSPQPAASTCSQSSDCQPHLACSKGSCVSRGGVGSPCSSSRDCGIFLGCLENECARRPVIGESCSLLLPCLWGACSQLGADGGFVCSEPAGPGARCGGDDACASGRCEQGQCLAACTP